MSFRKLFQRSNNDHMDSSLKHSKSMYGMSSRSRKPDVDPLKPVYRGKTPLKTSDIVYIEKTPGMLDDDRTARYMGYGCNPPTSLFPSTHDDLLDQFPNPPGPPPRPARNPLRSTSLNSHNSKSQVSTTAYSTTAQPIIGREQSMHRSPSVTSYSRPTASAYPSLNKQRRREATADQAMQNILKTDPDRPPMLGSSRQAERVRAKSQTGPSYRAACPVPPTPSPRPFIQRPAPGSGGDLRRVASQIAIPRTAAPDHGQSYWPHADYREFLREQDPRIICAMIDRYPVAPLRTERVPEHLRPIRYDMNEQAQFQKTLSYWIHIAVAQGRPLDARAAGPYRRIVEAGEPTGIVPEVGTDWSQRMRHRY